MKKPFIWLVCFCIYGTSNVNAQSNASSLDSFLNERYETDFRRLDKECMTGIAWVKGSFKKNGSVSVLISFGTPVLIDTFLRQSLLFMPGNISSDLRKQLKGNSFVMPVYYSFTGGCPVSKTSPEYVLQQAESGKTHNLTQDIINNTNFGKDVPMQPMILLQGIVIVQKDKPHDMVR